MAIDVQRDYWKIVNKAINDLETRLNSLKESKSFEIKVDTLFEFIEMNKNYLSERVVCVEYYGCCNHMMYDVGNGLFYSDVSEHLYSDTGRLFPALNPVTIVSAFKLSHDEEINGILKSINQQLKDYIEKAKG